MSLTVCLAPANTVAYPNGGGHLWVYLHWALALKALGCRVIWLEGIDVDDSDTSPAGRRRRRGGRAVDCVANPQRTRLEPYGLADTLALYTMNGPRPGGRRPRLGDLDAAAGADLLLNLWHSAPARVVQRFRRTAFVDTDPGLLQIWMTTGAVDLALHDIYFTIGETVGQPGAPFPTAAGPGCTRPLPSSCRSGPCCRPAGPAATPPWRIGGAGPSSTTAPPSPTRSARRSSSIRTCRSGRLSARAGGLPRRIPRGVPADARAKGMAAAGGMGRDRDPGRVPDIRAALRAASSAAPSRRTSRSTPPG